MRCHSSQRRLRFWLLPVAHTVTPREVGRGGGGLALSGGGCTHTCVTRTHGALVTRAARRALCEYARARVVFVLCHCVCSHVPLWCPLFVRGDAECAVTPARGASASGSIPFLRKVTAHRSPPFRPSRGVSEGGSRALCSHHFAGTQQTSQGWDDPVPSLQPHLRRRMGACVSAPRLTGALPSSAVRAPCGRV